MTKYAARPESELSVAVRLLSHVGMLTCRGLQVAFGDVGRVHAWGMLACLAVFPAACASSDHSGSGGTGHSGSGGSGHSGSGGTGHSGSGGTGHSGSGAVPPAPADWSRVLLVLDRQVSAADFGSDVVNLYADPTDVPFMTVRSVAEKYGVSASVVADLTLYLAEQLHQHAPSSSTYHDYSQQAWLTYLSSPGGLEVDVTGTFASLLIPKYLAEALFSKALKEHASVAAVPKGMPGVSYVLTAFARWTGRASQIDGRAPERSVKVDAEVNVEDGYYGSPRDWPAWTQTPGDHTNLTCPQGFDCLSTWPYPYGESATLLFPSQLRTAYRIPHDAIGTGRTAVVLEWGEMTEDLLINAQVASMNANRPPGVPEYTFVAHDSMSAHATSNFIQHAFDGASARTGAEATVDVQALLAVAPGLERITLLNGRDDDLLVYIPYVISQSLDPQWTGGSVPDVVSISYGFCEQLWRLEAGEAAFAAIEPLFMTAAAVGVSVSVAAGDQGSTGCAPGAPPFWGIDFLALDYPASSPWVTAVGGTSLELDNDNHIAAVSSWNEWYLQVERPLRKAGCSESDLGCVYTCAVAPCRTNAAWASTGGNSIIFDQPPWQREAGVGGTKRAVPDVAFFASNYPGLLAPVLGSQPSKIRWGAGAGTSQAAPLFAGMLALMNNHVRGRVGLSTPLLYQFGRSHPEAFWDVVENEQTVQQIDPDGSVKRQRVNVNNNIVGDNTGQFDVPCCYAKAGHDRTTGFGTLLYDEATAAWDALAAPPSALGQ